MTVETKTNFPEAVIIKPEQLQPETLQAVIESFILREGTDYGRQEISLETKVEQIQKQLLRKEIFIVFDPESQSVTLVKAQLIANHSSKI